LSNWSFTQHHYDIIVSASMAVHAAPTPRVTRLPAHTVLLRAGIIVFVAYHLGLALLMAAAPHSFFEAIGAYNDHYIRDTATFEAAIGAALLISLGRPGWRDPVLGLATIQFALHSVNHLLDIGDAHPAWTGYADFFSLATSTLVLGWLWLQARREAPGPSAA